MRSNNYKFYSFWFGLTRCHMVFWTPKKSTPGAKYHIIYWTRVRISNGILNPGSIFRGSKYHITSGSNTRYTTINEIMITITALMWMKTTSEYFNNYKWENILCSIVCVQFQPLNNNIVIYLLFNWYNVV